MPILKYNNVILKMAGTVLKYDNTNPPDPNEGFWVHKTTGVVTPLLISDPSISEGTFSRPSWAADVRDIKLPEGVTVLGDNCLSGNAGLLNVDMPTTTTTIGLQAMQDAIYIEVITVRALTPPSFNLSGGGNVGSSSPSLVIYVPSSSLSAYQTTSPWSSANIVSRLTPIPS